MFIKITKAQARAMYGKGTFYMVPCKMKPDGMFACKVSPTSFESLTGVDFDTMVNQFEYYNCGYLEVGRRAAFYIKA